jgi:hypothetical protein
MAITDPVMLKCTNLDGLIKQRGDVVEEEKALWAAMGCEEKLKGLYTQWKQHSVKKTHTRNTDGVPQRDRGRAKVFFFRLFKFFFRPCSPA